MSDQLAFALTALAVVMVIEVVATVVLFGLLLISEYRGRSNEAPDGED